MVVGVIVIVAALAIALQLRFFEPATTSEAVSAVGTVSGDLITAIIAAATLVAVYLLYKSVGLLDKSVGEQAKLVEEEVKQLKADACQNVSQEMLTIGRWMADHPEYLHAVTRPKTEDSALGTSVAEVFADLIDHVSSQAPFLPEGYEGYWDDYFVHIIGTWPQLDKFITKHRNWYGPHTKALLKKAHALSASDSVSSA
ncbi:MAG: hypothetical protein ACLP4W_22430 [Mycobacterium sp.]|uniref:hypothetical protein n=1 Tax=Mycobacterium sp. TaxID=1785 RepID=UPI003F9D20F7